MDGGGVEDVGFVEVDVGVGEGRQGQRRRIRCVRGGVRLRVGDYGAEGVFAGDGEVVCYWI